MSAITLTGVIDQGRALLAVCTSNGCGWHEPSATRPGAVVLAEHHARSTGHPRRGVVVVNRGDADKRRAS